jgi:sugar O-acyltransferase (sialic acid O-acetyltransferase NeuD family)
MTEADAARLSRAPGNQVERQPLLLVGAGGFGRETAEAIRASNEITPRWDLLGFLDDDDALIGETIDGLPVIGRIDEAHRYPKARLVLCTGHPGNYTSRKVIAERLGLPASRYATIVHPTAVVPSATTIGPGSVLLATVVITARITIGSHVAAMPGVVFSHDDVVGDYCTFGAGVRLAGRVTVCEGAYIGSGAMVREDRTVGSWSLVGMGSVVTRDVPAREVWLGVPARFQRRALIAAPTGLERKI